MSQCAVLCFWMVATAVSLVECNPKCGDEIRKSKGTIVLGRPKDSHCTWTIVVSKTRGVTFRISALRVAQINPSTCHDSYLKLEEVRGERRTLLKDYCKSVPRDYIKTRHNQVMVSAYNVGFKLTWNVNVPRGVNRKTVEMSTTLENHETTVNTQKENVFLNLLKEKKYIVLAVASGMCVTFIIIFAAMKTRARRRDLGVIGGENHEMNVTSEMSGQLTTRKSVQGVCEEIFRQDLEDDYDEIHIDKSDGQNGYMKISRQNTSSRHQQNEGRGKTTHTCMEDRCLDLSSVCKQENGDDLNDYTNQFNHGKNQTERREENLRNRACPFLTESTADSTLYANSYQVMRSCTLSSSSSDSAEYVNITDAM